MKNYETVDTGEPQIYVPFAQRPSREMTVVVRATGDAESLIATVRDVVAASILQSRSRGSSPWTR